MSRNVLIICAVTGGHGTFAKVADFLVTPEQIVRDGLAAREAEAAVVHIHVLDCETGQLGLFCEAVKAIRNSGSDVLINLSAGWGGRHEPRDDDVLTPRLGTNFSVSERRVLHVIDLRLPENSPQRQSSSPMSARSSRTLGHVMHRAAFG